MRTDKVVSQRLKQARLRAGLTQEGLGVKAGIDEMTASARMNQYERGMHLPRPFMLEHIARVLGVPLPFFYAADEELAEVVWRFGKLSKDERRKVLALMRQLGREDYKKT